MTSLNLLHWIREAGLCVWVEDSNLRVRSESPLTDEQSGLLRTYKPALLSAITEPHGNRYLWRRKDPHNVAGWHSLYSEQTISDVRLTLGDDFEVREVKETLIKSSPSMGREW